ncbi:MAG: exodeoxyribonuclease V subunit alpha [Rhodoferax sp.]|nr:exodeoxyribonuclease V subunit alpha [Rhodoferax sp.]
MNTLAASSAQAKTALPDSASAPAAATLALLHGWADRAWLRRLDSALAAFVFEQDPGAHPVLLVCTAVLAQMEGRGHTCLPLRLLADCPHDLLAWPTPAYAQVQLLWGSLPTGLEDWLGALRASPLVRSAQDSTDRGEPLVLSGTVDEPLLYLRRYWLHEQQVAHAVLQRCASSHVVNEPLAALWLDRLFATEPPAAPADREVDWQKLACALTLRAGLTVITGGPGTGKTYTAARLLALLFAMSPAPQQLRVALAAPTGKAAARLRQSIDFSLQELSARLGGELDLASLTQRMGAARTLHALLGARVDSREFRMNAENPLDVDILVVDEASMIHLEMMSALLQALPAGARLILLGDKDQLASVEAGAVLGDLCRDAAAAHYSAETARYAHATSAQVLPKELLDTGTQATLLGQQTVMLRKSRRFGGRIGQLALAVNAGQGDLAQHLLQSDTSGVLGALRQPGGRTVSDLAVQGRPGAAACYADYLRCLQARTPAQLTQADGHAAWVTSVLVAFDRFRILCAVHDGDWGTQRLNQSVQQALEQAGLLKPRGEWFAGRPVMVTRNDPALGVFNGDVGVALPGPPGATALRVYFLDGEHLRSVGVARLPHVETAFAMTVHKSQGSEFMHTALVLPQGGGKVLTRELVYTGITRARASFTLIEAQPGLLGLAIGSVSKRASGLQMPMSGRVQ